jgi:hypothetical protein
MDRELDMFEPNDLDTLRQQEFWPHRSIRDMWAKLGSPMPRVPISKQWDVA